MPTVRSYHDSCGIARALDVVGERWALLVVRELLLGPQRFSELRKALANVSANVLADRLRELEANGVLQRRKLPAPSASWVYELTPRGQELESVLTALGDWGVQLMPPSPPNVLSPTSALIYLRSCARPDAQKPSTVVRIELDDQIWTVQTDHADLTIEVGDAADADATLESDPYTFSALIGDTQALKRGIRDGTVEVTGDLGAVIRMLQEVELNGS
jgi:DNA-binding HxlR family transcriptional regulator